MDKLLVVDGSNLLFQMFYGMPAKIRNKEGKLIHGTLGFVGALLKTARKLRPTHLVVLFDGEHKNDREEIDERYKANRPDFSQMEEEEQPFSQLPDVKNALDYLGIRYAETTTCETDDWVASYALALDENTELVVSSFDSDFFQLVSEKVSVFRYRGDNSVLCTPDFVKEKYGVFPSQYADYKCLVGDTADNVQGVRGIGPKTAKRLLCEFGSLEGILQNLEAVCPPSAREGLRASVERLKINEKLIRLTGGERLPFALGELAFVDKGEKTGEVLRKIGAQ